jgi:hypothetical protein
VSELPQIVKQRMAAMPPQEHPEANLLTAFAEQALRPEEREQMLVHLAACADCRDVVALASPDIEVPGVQSSSPIVPQPTGWQFMRWGTLAASMAILAVVILVRAPELNQRSPDYTQTRSVPAPTPSQAAEEPPQSGGGGGGAGGRTRDKNEVAAIGNRPETQADTSSRGYFEAAPGRAAQPLKRKSAEAGATAGVNPPSPAPAAPLYDAQSVPSQAPGGSTQTYAALSKPRKDAAEPTSADDSFQSDGEGLNESRSAAKTASRPVVAMSAPPPPPAAQPEVAAQMEKQDSKSRAENEYAASGASLSAANDKLETSQTVAAETAPAETKDKKLSDADVAAWRWRARDGLLQRSRDGRTWEEVKIAEGVRVSSVTVSGRSVWASGGGMLYHSKDGATWERSNGAFGGAVRELEFSSFLDGRLVTANGEIWVTRDGGRTWERQ